MLKILLTLVLVFFFLLAIRRRGMWIPRFLLSLSLLLPFLFKVFKATLLVLLYELITLGLWLLFALILARSITPLTPNHPEFRRSWGLLWCYLVRMMISFHPSAFVVERGGFKRVIERGGFNKVLSKVIQRVETACAPVLVRSDTVAILQRDMAPSRVVGNQLTFRPDLASRRGQNIEGNRTQGTTICFLEPYEALKGAIDLRPRRRTGTLRTTTGDSMEVTLQLLMDLSLARQEEKRLEFFYSYDPAGILRAFYLQSIGELGMISWDERAFSIAKAQLNKAVSHYTLGEFYGGDQNRCSSEILEEELRKELGKSLFPVNVNMMRVTLQGVSPQVVDYYLKNWEVGIELSEKPREAEAEAAYWRQVCEARFYLFQELVEKISEALREVSGGTLEVTLAMRLANIVEEIACSLASKGLLPPEAARALEEVGILRTLLPGRS